MYLSSFDPALLLLQATARAMQTTRDSFLLSETVFEVRLRKVQNIF